MYKQNYWKSVIGMSLLLVAVSGTGYHFAHLTPVRSDVVKAQAISTPTPTPTEIPTDFVNYVRFKFGDDSHKAFLLLQGSEKCQGENPKMSPNAMCDNTLWGGKGQDRGYWQISNVYHPHVSDWCAKDVKCSTDYIFRMYTNDGNTFSKRWTAGKCLKANGFDI